MKGRKGTGTHLSHEIEVRVTALITREIFKRLAVTFAMRCIL